MKEVHGALDDLSGWCPRWRFVACVNVQPSFLKIQCSAQSIELVLVMVGLVDVANMDLGSDFWLKQDTYLRK